MTGKAWLKATYHTQKKGKTCLKLCTAPVVKSIPQPAINRHQYKWEAVGKAYKRPNTDNLLLTGPVVPRRSFPPLWLYLSLSHTGLHTSNVSNGEGKYSTHLQSVFPYLTLRTPSKTPAVSSRERVLREYQVTQWSDEDTSYLIGNGLWGIFHPQGDP